MSEPLRRDLPEPCHRCGEPTYVSRWFDPPAGQVVLDATARVKRPTCPECCAELDDRGEPLSLN